MSDGKIISLSPLATSREPDETVIRILRNLFEAAERGEVRAVAVATVDGGNWVNAEWCIGNVDPAMLTGAVTRMQFKMLEAWDDR